MMTCQSCAMEARVQVTKRNNSVHVSVHLTKCSWDSSVEYRNEKDEIVSRKDSFATATQVVQ